MKVIHINFDSGFTGGATLALHRIHDSLSRQGIESKIFCRMLAECPGSHVVPYSFFSRIERFVLKCLTRLLIGRVELVSFVDTGLADVINRENPDVVVLHWLQLGTISFGELSKLNAPVLWFHHDLWPIRGLTAHAGETQSCVLRIYDRLVQNVKRSYIRKAKKIIPICASRWVASEIVTSGVFSIPPLVQCFPIDDCFKTGRRTPHCKFRILNGARGGFKAGNKGGDRLLAALSLLPTNVRQNVEVVVFGSNGSVETHLGVEVHYVGCLRGDTLAQQYRDADIFAFPSRRETFGQTKIESIACGTPVVAFDETACAEGIVHGRTGWIAASDDVADFAKGILYFYDRWAIGCPVRVEGEAKGYSMDAVGKQWCSLLQEVCK